MAFLRGRISFLHRAGFVRVGRQAARGLIRSTAIVRGRKTHGPEVWSALMGTMLFMVVATTGRAAANTNDTASPDRPTIGSLREFEALSSVPPTQEYRLRTTFNVYCYDPEWGVMWAGENHLAHFIAPPAERLFQTGRVYELDGIVYPGRHAIDWARTHVTPKGDAPPDEVMPLDDQAREFDQFAEHYVEFEALVDGQIQRGPRHVRLDLIVADRALWAWVQIPDQTPPPALSGAFVRIRGVLAIRRDSSGEIVRRELWVGPAAGIRPVSRLRDDPRFNQPPTTIDAIGARPHDTLRLQGVVRAQEPAQWLILRDPTGQLKLSTLQSEVVRPGDAVDALVYPGSRNSDTGLRRAIFRRLASDRGPHADQSAPGIRLVEQIRDLPVNSQLNDRHVELKGVVTWSAVDSKFFFFEDGSGGIKAYLPDTKPVTIPNPNTGVSIVGTLRAEGGVPVVVCSSVLTGKRDIAIGQPPEITLEEALAGGMDARTVRIRGHVRSVIRGGAFAEISLSTAGGELTGLVPAQHLGRPIEGGIVELRGVCDATFDAANRATGIRVWIATDEDIRVLEASDPKPFATARRSLSSLLQFSAENNVNRRVQLTGVVLLHRPGEFLYLQDADDSLMVLTRSGEQLQPGDRIDVVGFPGHEGWQPVLREAIFRKVGSGPQPSARTLLNLHVPDRALDGKLVRLTATLLDVVRKGSGARLQLQANQTIFESSWDAAGEMPSWERGSLLALTGVYCVELDVARRPRAFVLRLRAPGDVQVLSRPPWWNFYRILWASAGFLVVASVATIGVVVLSRKNRALREANRKVHEINAGLENRVARRTADLTKEIAERRSSEAKLANQEKLLRTLIDGLPVCLYVKDASGRFLTSNLEHTRLLGAVAEAEVIGKSLRDFHPLAEAQQAEREDQEILQRGEPLLAHEQRLHTAAGERWHSVTKMPVRDTAGRITSLVGISLDVTARKQAETERENLQAQLIAISRQAGMADVAASVLHQVGNCLTSVNVSATLVTEGIRKSRLDLLDKIAGVLQENAADLPSFFAKDTRAKVVPRLLAELAENFGSEQRNSLAELARLTEGIDRIQAVLATQQNLADGTDLLETVKTVGLMDEALRLHQPAGGNGGVTIVRQYAADAEVRVDRQKIVCALRNLLRYGDSAGAGSAPPPITVFARVKTEGQSALLEVEYDRVGIARENLTRVFAPDFRVHSRDRTNDLHASALAAQQSGGSLTAAQAGGGQGTVFVLALPLAAPVPSR